MKKYVMILFLIIVGAFFISPSEVEATNYPSIDVDYDYVFNSCIDDKTCMLVCNYTYNGDPEISIFYNFVEKEWEVGWNSNASSGQLITIRTGKFNHVFAQNEVVFIPVRDDKAPYHSNSKFQCPKNAYRDHSILNPYNEVCFDNNGKWCEEDMSNTGTDFEPVDEKQYDYEDEMDSAFSSWYSVVHANNYTCENVYNRVNVGQNVIDDFKETMLSYTFNGIKVDQIPTFLENSDAMANIKTKVTDDYISLANVCKQQTDNAYEKGAITEEVYNDRIDAINEVISITETVQKVELNPNKNGATLDNWNNPDTPVECEDIFEFDKEGSVGWLLQTIFNYIKVIGPILLVLLSSMDFIKAVLGSDEKAMKEAQSKLVIRLIAALALFLIPTLIQLLLSFINVTLSDGCYVK